MMSGRALSATLRSRAILVLFSAILVHVFLVPAVLGQPNVLVTSRYSNLSVFNLSLGTNLESIPGGYITWSVVVDPLNPRLAYVGSATYITVFDLTIQKPVNRIYGLSGLGPMAFTSDGKYLLVADNTYSSLDVVDLGGQKLVKRIGLLTTMGSGAQGSALGTLVVVGNQVYVTSQATNSSRPAIAVVDVRTWAVRPIRLPAGGQFDACCYGSPNAGATPDQKYVVMAQTNYGDGSFHLFFISTSANHAVLDKPQTTDPWGLLISPVNNPGSNYGYLLSNGQAGMIDMNQGSPSFGQPIPNTTVSYGSFGAPTAAAISPDGAELVVGGFQAWTTQPPNPNLIEISTSSMLNNPSGAVIGHATANGGVRPFGITIAPITTTPPQSAPTVSGVTPATISNSSSNSITITGTNFQPGATVRIGTMPPIPATVSSSTTLLATVPQNAPAAATMRVMVTNPNLSSPRGQQYQSGVLTSALTISPNPVFQPQNLFASAQVGPYGVSVYNPSTGSMVNNGASPPSLGITFNTDGAGIYGASYGPRGAVNHPQVVDWNPSNMSVKTRVPFAVTNNSSLSQQLGLIALAASVNPNTGNAVVFTPVGTNNSNLWDLALEAVDTDSSSGTFNTVIGTITAGLNLNGFFVHPWACAATPDGRYVYVIYQTGPTQGQGTTSYYMATFDILHSVANTVPLGALGVSQSPSYMAVTSDGQSLLISGFSQIPTASGPIAVLDLSVQPANPVLVTNILGTAPGRTGGVGRLTSPVSR